MALNEISNHCMSPLPTLVLLLLLLTIITSLTTSAIPVTTPWPDNLPLRTDPNSTAAVSTDFGLLTRSIPAAVLRPFTPDDINALIRLSYTSTTRNSFSVAPRGQGHSVRGQAAAPSDGVVVDMRSLGGGHGGGRINVSCGYGMSSPAYVDAGGEQLWVDVLREAMGFGLAPPSWTDYLWLTVGGTLSNAGISGQAFRHGPQISNVYELDVITGKGELITCSEDHMQDLFHAVLGGLGQFGIITRARIALEAAPHGVRWLRMIYTDFHDFARDQEHLISLGSDGGWKDGVAGDRSTRKRGFDYVEGSLNLGQSPSRRSSFFSDEDMRRIDALSEAAPPEQRGILYYVEAAMYYDQGSESLVDQDIGSLLKDLRYTPGYVFVKNVSYMAFLDRVHDEEMKMREQGMWEVPHPWLILFVPRSRVHDFDAEVFRGVLGKQQESVVGFIIVSPMNRTKWDERTSVVIPRDEEVFYAVSFLRSAANGDAVLEVEKQNEEILSLSDRLGIGYKQYLPHYKSREEWAKHFGPKWGMFVERKRRYDPRAILSPGQGIFPSPTPLV